MFSPPESRSHHKTGNRSRSHHQKNPTVGIPCLDHLLLLLPAFTPWLFPISEVSVVRNQGNFSSRQAGPRIQISKKIGPPRWPPCPHSRLVRRSSPWSLGSAPPVERRACSKILLKTTQRVPGFKFQRKLAHRGEHHVPIQGWSDVQVHGLLVLHCQLRREPAQQFR